MARSVAEQKKAASRENSRLRSLMRAVDAVEMDAPAAVLKQAPVPQLRDWSNFAAPLDVTPNRPEPGTDLQTVDEPVHEVMELVPLALSSFKRIMKHTPLITTQEDYVQKAKLVLATATAVTSLQTKIDENQLKATKVDAIASILAELRDEEEKQREALRAAQRLYNQSTQDGSRGQR